jgi:transcription elongation factor GreA
MKSYRLTEEGIQKLKAEREQLLIQYHTAAERIKDASDMANAAENSEYSVARDEQEAIEKRLATINAILRNTQLINQSRHNDTIVVGSIVHVEGEGSRQQFQVVGTLEADPMHGKVSDESPLGKALLGKKVKDTVLVKTPMKAIVYTVISID